MHVLVTRPKNDADALAAALEGLGVQVSVAPLLEIELEPIPPNALSRASAIVVTSRNGVRALAQSAKPELLCDRPIVCVGAATARLATELGFEDARTGPGTAAALAAAIASGALEPIDKSRPWLHLAGDHLAADLTDDLAKSGITLERVIAYRSVAARTLPVPVAADLANGTIDAVVLMSPRTATVWPRLAQAIGTGYSRLNHVCLSGAVATALKSAAGPSLPHEKIFVASRPETEEILALVKRLAAQ